jgi:putative MATE family efflux protein
MRAAGDTRTPMWLTSAGVVLSVALAYIFIDVLGIGPMGSAWAQAITWFLGMTAMFVILWRGVAGLSIAGGPWHLTMTTIRRIFSISLPSAGESATFSFGILALSGLVFRLGTDQVAAHQIVGQIETFSFFPCIGFSSAASALVGQALGMNDVRRATRAGWSAAGMAVVWSIIAGSAFVLFLAFLIGIFTNSPEVVVAGLGALAVIGIAQPAQGAIFTLGGALRGAGDTRFPLVSILTGLFVFRLGGALLVSRVFGGSVVAVWCCLLMDYTAKASLLSARFASGRWKDMRI